MHPTRDLRKNMVYPGVSLLFVQYVHRTQAAEPKSGRRPYAIIGFLQNSK